MTTDQLLKLAINEATSKISDYTPSDLNTLIKTLLSAKKEEETITIETPKLKGFLEDNLIK